MQIQISWLLQKPTDLDLHCLQRQDISGFSRTRVKMLFFLSLQDGDTSSESNLHFNDPDSASISSTKGNTNFGNPLFQMNEDDL